MNEQITNPKRELHVLRDLLRKAFAEIPRSEWASRMGYQGRKQQVEERIEGVLSDEWLGLEACAYDLRYNSQDFVKVMAEVSGVTSLDVPALVDRSRQWIDVEQQAFKPYLFVDTGFRRTTEPVQVLAAAQHNRYLYFEEPGFRQLDEGEQLARAQARVRQHMKQTGGTLPVWGKIRSYRFHYREGAFHDLSTDGEVVDS